MAQGGGRWGGIMLLSRSSFAASRAERLALHFKLGKQDGWLAGLTRALIAQFCCEGVLWGRELPILAVSSRFPVLFRRDLWCLTRCPAVSNR